MADHRAVPRMIVRPDLVKGHLPTATAQPDRLFYILHEDVLWECDGYKHPGAGNDFMIVLTCPACGNHLTLDSRKKKLEITEEGILSETFQCSHRAQFGGPCPWTVVLDRPRGDNRRVQVNGRWYTVDAVARSNRR